MVAPTPTREALSAVGNLESALAGVDLDTLVVVEQSPYFPGVLVFQPPGEVWGAQAFLRRYGHDPAWVSRFLVLNEAFMLRAFVDVLERDGWTVVFGPSAAPILAAYERWDRPIDIEGFRCPHDGQLHPFQHFMVRRALERAEADTTAGRLTVPGWCAGAGKTAVFAPAGAQELANRGQIDLVLAFTLMHHKVNLVRYFTEATTLTAVVNDGDKKRRRAGYRQARTAAGEVDVFSLNYDKARHDYDELSEITRGRRVLFVFDEVQYVLNAEVENRSRLALNDLIAGCHAIVWPMTASIVDSSPLRYHNLFDLAQGDNPLGGRNDFIARYARSVKTRDVKPKRGGNYTVIDYDWDFPTLHEVRHRVADRVQNARKSDPGVREVFPPLQVEWVPIQMSPEDRELYEAVDHLAELAKEAEEDTGPYTLMRRYICNTPEALLHSCSPVAAALRDAYPHLVTSAHSAKLAYFLDQVESIAEAGDKVVAFTKWTNLGLQMVHRELERRKIRHVVHFGAGQSSRERQWAQDRFKGDDKITLFLSSDAGAEALNLQEARYCINYEPPYSYQKLMQRINRIHRADSQHAGLTAYVYCTENSIEERARDVCEERRQLAEATLGTSETLELAEHL